MTCWSGESVRGGACNKFGRIDETYVSTCGELGGGERSIRGESEATWREIGYRGVEEEGLGEGCGMDPLERCGSGN